ncbi:F-box protein At4g09920-like [Magnolia sinica]|uniref:F-box protein At4g09920-like n=1 Tax=Magnolia sinica TaxID=86752 RepID=UPI00265B6677|nr:F-box protein At4g09920-like [Magnolia sinica]
MEKTIDRISQLPDVLHYLPDDVLHYILSLMPLKLLVRTSILSSKWRNLWKSIRAYDTALDLGVEFTSGQTQEEFVTTVNRYLQLHKSKEIQIFRLSFLPCNQSNAEKWVEFAAAKRVKELHIDFKEHVPYKFLNSIFDCDCITHLNLSGGDFRLALNFKGFTYLKTLHLSDFRVTDALFEIMLSNCPLLEDLSLRSCPDLTRVKVSAPDLPLKRLTVFKCCNLNEIEIFAPNLQSFYFDGSFVRTAMSFKNISSLVDVFVNGRSRDLYNQSRDWITVLNHLKHVNILTLCDVSLKHVHYDWYGRIHDLPITFYNLQELELLVDRSESLFPVLTYSFFKKCLSPSLEKLFIELLFTNIDEDKKLWAMQNRAMGCRTIETPDITFHHLKVIKINGCRGLYDELKLVKFFLEKSIVLEKLVLVVHPIGLRTKNVLRYLRRRVLLLANASSSNAHISICEYWDEDRSLAPVHDEVYHDKK